MNRPTLQGLGLELPGAGWGFLFGVAVHRVAGLVAAESGAVAAASTKDAGRHAIAGRVYFRSLCVVFVTAAALAAIRWPFDNPLLVLGVITVGAAAIGTWARRARPRGWPGPHVTAMGASYIAMLTAF